MLKQRLIFGILGVIVALAVLICGSVEFIGCAVGVIALIGLFEFYRVAGLFKKKSPVSYAGFLFTAIVFYLAIFYPDKIIDSLMLIIAGYVFVLMCSMVFFHSKCSFSDVALSFAGSLYISFFFVHIIFIRQLDLGYLYIWLIFITAWASDTFAYFAGRLLGRHKLCPSISPKKTIEGAIGGVLGCVICICVYAFCCEKFAFAGVNYILAVIFAAVCSVFSQLGDLVASCIKRENDVKDYGNLIPGHGGVLDRFDSSLFISPLVYYFILYYPIIFK